MMMRSWRWKFVKGRLWLDLACGIWEFSVGVDRIVVDELRFYLMDDFPGCLAYFGDRCVT